MTLKFLSKNKVTGACEHESQIRTEVAGMSREVCESCGKVTVGYIQSHIQPERAQELEASIRAFGVDSDD